MKPTKAATITARFTALLALGWAYLAYNDLRSLLFLHHMEVIHHLPIQYNYPAYLACHIFNLAAPILLAIIVFAFPGPFLRWLTPGAGKATSWSGGLVASIVAIGLALFGWGFNLVLNTAMVAIFTHGKYANWQISLCAYLAAAAVGIFLCRKALSGRQAEW
ncbi:MAG TPA: hypothetical protein VHY22_04545 [Chthoniobacteraceae bacterium]|jgi:hypothetical protein|nr:hypothetical protein [Chthoniobacteraceae bacterium]